MNAARKPYPEPCDRVGQRSARRLTLLRPDADSRRVDVLTRRPCGDMRAVILSEHATRELLHACLSGAALWCIMAMAIALACFV